MQRIFSFLFVTAALAFSPGLQAGDRTDTASFTLAVEHDHLWGSGSGKLTVNSDGVSFEEEKEKSHSRHWSFTDLQEVKIESPYELALLTYEDVKWKLNRDRVFKFKLRKGEITSDLVLFLDKQLPSPLVSAVFPTAEDVYYIVPAKHKHALGGGCDGQLMFGREGVYFVSSNAEHSRRWRIEEIEGLGRRSQFEVRVTVREHFASRGERNFQFQLKRPIDEAAYEIFWRKVYEPESWLEQLAAKH